jgi:hypothetical protein
MHDPSIELGVEVHSAWGTFEWLVEDALQRGHRIGICANSDGHKGRPGASYPGASRFGSYGGLTCVLARKLDRESVLEALFARHFYATTGNRCLVEVELLMGDGRKAMMGDVIPAHTPETGAECSPRFRVRVVGTAPVESVEVRNGLQVIDVYRPYDAKELGRRFKVVWSGAEVRGRDRMVAWDGSLSVTGNAILGAKPIHFWNADQPLERNGNQLSWKSITTGGLAGVILTLENAQGGTLRLDTPQSQAACQIDTLGLEPTVWQCGGLRKRIEAYRLPNPRKASGGDWGEAGPYEFAFEVPLVGLQEGDNPVYVRLAQEDGHMAWTSPVYVTA